MASDPLSLGPMVRVASVCQRPRTTPRYLPIVGFHRFCALTASKLKLAPFCMGGNPTAVLRELGHLPLCELGSARIPKRTNTRLGTPSGVSCSQPLIAALAVIATAAVGSTYLDQPQPLDCAKLASIGLGKLCRRAKRTRTPIDAARGTAIRRPKKPNK